MGFYYLPGNGYSLHACAIAPPEAKCAAQAPNVCFCDGGNMIDPKTLDGLVAKIAEGLPAGIGQVHEDLRNNAQAAMSAALTRMNLVSREEFDVQSAVLARTREKLTALEAKVGELEEFLDRRQAPSDPTPAG